MENNKTINDLPLALVQEILLRLPVKSVLRVRCVCKTWLYLISDPNFAKSHFELAAAPTRRCLCFKRSEALSFDLDALLHDGHTPVSVSLPFQFPAMYGTLESCRGFILFDTYPCLFIWNPSTGAHKRISYPHIVKGRDLSFVGNMLFHGFGLLLGFGYDTSNDDYLVVLGLRDNKEDRFNFFSVRNNSWMNFGVGLPNLVKDKMWSTGLFFNGAFHWLAFCCHRDDAILVFDLNKRRFSDIPLPERLVIGGWYLLFELGGCLALYSLSTDYDECKLEIWVMKEYKVQSSWKLLGKFDPGLKPISLSNEGDIIGFDPKTRRFSKYDVDGQKLEQCSSPCCQYIGHTVYTESLISLPNDSKTKTNGHRLC